MKLRKLNSTFESKVFLDDPVRPHINDDFRTSNGREVYVLETDDKIDAVICVAYTAEVPTNESDLQFVGDNCAVFYTVWSYSRGAGREIVNQASSYIKETRPEINRFVTLSPLTDMAKRFHLRNGAKFIARHMDCQNFEYFI